MDGLFLCLFQRAKLLQLLVRLSHTRNRMGLAITSPYFFLFPVSYPAFTDIFRGVAAATLGRDSLKTPSFMTASILD